MGEDASEGGDSRPQTGASDLRHLLPGVEEVADGRGFFSIGTRLAAAVVLVVTVATALTFVWFSDRERSALVDAKRKSADMVADLFAATLGAPVNFGDDEGVRTELANLSGNKDITAAVVWHGADPKPMAEYRAAGQAKASAARQAPGTRVEEDHVTTVRLVRDPQGGPVGLATIEFSLARENLAFAESRKQILFSCFALALGTMLLLLVVARTQVVRPINALLRAVRRVERGERRVAVEIVRADEIGRLARAFQAMDGAIADREERLADALKSLRELFDHMRQAIIVFDRDGRVVGAQSREASVAFERSELKGAQIRELLYPDAGPWDAELGAFDDWVALAFAATPPDWPELATFAPPKVVLGDGADARVLALEFRPIVIEGEIRRVMLLATDETEKQRLERKVVAQEERHERQMAAMRRLVSGGGQQFVVFLEGARRRLARSLEICAGQSAISVDAVTELFGHVHTLRGEARVFGLDDLGSALELVESRISELRALLIGARSTQVSLRGSDLEELLGQCRSLLDQAERLFVEASPIGRAVLEQVTVRRPDLSRLCELCARQVGELGRLAEVLSARSLGEIVAPIAENVGRWLNSVDKRASLEVEGREILVPERLARVLAGTLTHLVKNAIAHGLESPEDREKSGKGPSGTLRISATSASGELWPVIHVEDDGRGIAGNRLLAAAAARGAPLLSGDAQAGSFREKPTSEHAPLSGRGVGLHAVVHDLDGVGYCLKVERRDGTSRFSILPRNAVRAGVQPEVAP